MRSASPSEPPITKIIWLVPDVPRESIFCDSSTESIEVPEGNNILSIIVVNDKTKLTSEIYRTNFIYHAQPEVEIEE